MKLMSSFGFAWRGIRTAVREQRNMRIHLGIALLVIVAGVYFSISLTDWCIVALAIALVLTAELINTSIENLADMVEARPHPQIGKVKDAAAGGVLLAAIGAAVTGILVFAKYVTA